MITGSVLDLKRKLLVDEACKLKKIDGLLGEARETLARGITEDQDEPNWDLAFVKFCINEVEKACDNLGIEHKKSEFNWKDKTLDMWMDMDRRYRKQRASVGDIVIMHYVKHGQLLTSGQIGIITEVNQNLTVQTLEGGVVSQFEDVPIHQQHMGIHRKLRTSKGTAKMRVLGYFSPWLDR